MSKRGFFAVVAAALWTAAVAVGIWQVAAEAAVGVLGGTIVGAACMVTGWVLADEMMERAVRRATRRVQDVNDHMLDSVAARLAAAFDEADEVDDYRPPLRSI